MKKKVFKKLLILMMCLPGPVLYLAYKLIVNYYNFHFGFSGEKVNLSIVIGTFSFTMLGFMATIITLITVLDDKLHFKKYKANNYLEIFFIFYFLTIVNLFGTFVFSILNFAANRPQIFLDLMMILCVNSLVQTFVIGTIIYNLLKHSYKSHAPGTDDPLGRDVDVSSED